MKSRFTEFLESIEKLDKQTQIKKIENRIECKDFTNLQINKLKQKQKELIELLKEEKRNIQIEHCFNSKVLETLLNFYITNKTDLEYFLMKQNIDHKDNDKLKDYILTLFDEIELLQDTCIDFYNQINQKESEVTNG